MFIVYVYVCKGEGSYWLKYFEQEEGVNNSNSEKHTLISKCTIYCICDYFLVQRIPRRRVFPACLTPLQQWRVPPHHRYDLDPGKHSGGPSVDGVQQNDG